MFEPRINKIELLLPKKRSRVWEIDFLRGFCILLMIVDHFMFDFLYLPYWVNNFWQINNPIINFLTDFATYSYWSTTWRICARIVVFCIFLMLSGISSTFSKSNGVRAIKLTAAAIGLTCATIFIDNVAQMGVTILFGILHCLALSVALYTLIKALAGKDSKYWFLAFGIMIILIGVSFDYYWIPELKHAPSNIQDILSLVFGTKYYGADSFGLFPYTGVFFIGAFAGETIYKQKCSLLPKLNKAWNKPLCFVGRNTIWVYLLHQPVIMGLVVLITTLLGYSFFQ